MSATTMFERAANAAMGAILGSPSHAPSSTAGGEVSGDGPAAVAVKPPPAVSVKRDPFDGSPAHLEAVMTTLCVLVVPASAIDRDPWGHPLGSGPEFEPVELQRPGQPVTP